MTRDGVDRAISIQLGMFFSRRRPQFASLHPSNGPDHWRVHLHPHLLGSAVPDNRCKPSCASGTALHWLCTTLHWIHPEGRCEAALAGIILQDRILPPGPRSLCMYSTCPYSVSAHSEPVLQCFPEEPDQSAPRRLPSSRDLKPDMSALSHMAIAFLSLQTASVFGRALASAAKGTRRPSTRHLWP